MSARHDTPEWRRLPAGMTPRGLSRDAAATYLGVSPETFDANVRPQVPPVTIGNRLVWDVRALDRWLDEQSGLTDAFRSTDEWLAGLGNDRAHSGR